MSTLKCELCDADGSENYRIHSCFVIFCLQCSSGGRCKKCNHPFENCLEITAKKCVFYNVCKSLAVFSCSCKNQLLCDHDYYQTHQGSVSCSKELLSTFVQDKCEKCKMFIVSYIGPLKICAGCWKETADVERHNYIDVKEDSMKKIDNSLDQNAQESINGKNAIIRYNLRQFEIIVSKIKQFQQEFISSCDDNFNATLKRINNVTTSSTGVQYLKFAVANQQIALESVLARIEEWKKINAFLHEFPAIKFKEVTDTNGFSKFEISVETVNVDSIENCDSDMFNASVPITSPASSMAMSIGSGESSVLSYPAHCSKQPLQMLPTEERDWIKTKLTFFRDPFWIYVVDPEYMASRDQTLEILANDPILVQDFYRKKRYLKRAVCLGTRNNKIHSVYVQFLDYGNKCWVAESDMFDIPHIYEINITVQLVKMTGIAPISRFCFLKVEQEQMRDFIENNLVLIEKVIKIKPIARTNSEGTFCQFRAKIGDDEKDLSEMLIALGFDHTCSYCGQRHSVGGCTILKDELKKAKL
uniref:Tudor domain-containing protein n=1 Tax=Tetranychus urticae TaxID=32264 RepID=T1KSQ8_TETUR